jgi:hypothetical protein
MNFNDGLEQCAATTRWNLFVLDNGRRVWLEVQNVADDNDTHFPVIGQKYLSTKGVKLGQIEPVSGRVERQNRRRYGSRTPRGVSRYQRPVGPEC